MVLRLLQQGLERVRAGLEEVRKRLELDGRKCFQELTDARALEAALEAWLEYLISYTQAQCKLWKIPLTKSVPVEHVFDTKDGKWADGYFDLPISDANGEPMLFVPRRVVRLLPWINYNDFLRSEFRTYLRSKSRNSSTALELTEAQKVKVTAAAAREIERVDRYVSAKEATAAEAQPHSSITSADKICPDTEELKRKLAAIKPGREKATEYQLLVLEILNLLFVPELIDGELEVKTIDGTERRDIIFTNDSDKSFWDYLRSEHSAILLMFETKNTVDIEISHINQTATYLGDRLGRVGFIVTRTNPRDATTRKLFSVYNDSNPRKIIIVLSDDDLNAMLDMRCREQDPMRYAQRKYRKFRQTAQ